MTLVLLILMIAIRPADAWRIFLWPELCRRHCCAGAHDLIAPPWPEEVLMSAYVRRWTVTTA